MGPRHAHASSAFGAIGTQLIIFDSARPSVDNGSVAQWQRVGFQSRRLRVRFPRPGTIVLLLSFCSPSPLHLLSFSPGIYTVYTRAERAERACPSPLCVVVFVCWLGPRSSLSSAQKK